MRGTLVHIVDRGDHLQHGKQKHFNENHAASGLPNRPRGAWRALLKNGSKRLYPRRAGVASNSRLGSSTRCVHTCGTATRNRHSETTTRCIAVQDPADPCRTVYGVNRRVSGKGEWQGRCL